MVDITARRNLGRGGISFSVWIRDQEFITLWVLEAVEHFVPERMIYMEVNNCVIYRRNAWRLFDSWQTVLFSLRTWSTITKCNTCHLLSWADSSKLQMLALLLELREKQLQKPGRKGNSKTIKTLPVLSGNCFHHHSAFGNLGILYVKVIPLMGLLSMPSPYSLQQPLRGPARNHF